ncbi:hypothetical protein ONK27_25995, partial [Salmonella enterica subsp. enterica serovar Virginia]|nr:hypothetical protein [Salmonella enterica subsp. enterica serovar Virginia]
IYIYDASEMRNAVVSLRNVSLNEFNNFLKRSGLYNKNYPLRGGEWDKETEQEFITEIKVEMFNHQGALANLTAAINTTTSNIQSL